MFSVQTIKKQINIDLIHINSFKSRNVKYRDRVRFSRYSLWHSKGSTIRIGDQNTKKLFYFESMFNFRSNGVHSQYSMSYE